MNRTTISHLRSVPTAEPATPARYGWAYLFAAWTIALVATFGALFIGEVMGQTPCHLCWYQRVFMFPLAIILGVAAFREDGSVWRYALPVAVIGWLIAAFHSLLYGGVVPETIKPCGQGPSCSSADMTILGLPLPYLSLVAFTAIAVLLIPASRRKSNV
ncbi:disulfide bond formation protein B [Microvirga sp. ACRRW]|uniref:disulfide bond formation protein B n=1 Tax=Microvirga sp. ACRRW TaxID=2918205 RepID=UPI001EF50FD3|nr:disulfide bond formation protein B [Microvirga sp. ACRRW]MCG7392919.1 disulfide bond formation protein B [Microvirga sp. ACRRW]